MDQSGIRQGSGKRKAPKTAFRPGQSGNPAGRPKKTPEEFELEAACRAKTPDALNVITRIMETSDRDSVRLQAALAIIERAHGKPLQRAEIKTGTLDDLPREALKALRDELTSAVLAGESHTGATQGLTH